MKKQLLFAFEQYGLPATDALSYATNASNTPQAYTDPVNGTYSAGAVSSITVAWQEGDEYTEKNLERIITQKWIAMFPSTVEAWSEYRRTDYPHLLPVVVNNSGGTIDDTKAKYVACGIRPANIPVTGSIFWRPSVCWVALITALLLFGGTRNRDRRDMKLEM